MAKKSIVFLNQSSGYLMIDIINAFKGRYDERILITGMLNPRSSPLDNEVKLEWTVAYNRKNTLTRFYTWSRAFLKALVLIKIKYKKSELFLVSNPPFSVFLPLFCRNPFKFLIYDIFPDAMADLKLFSKSSLLVKIWAKVNRKVFKRAEKIFTLTDGMKKKLSNYVTPEKIKVVSIWTDDGLLKPVAKKENPFIRELELEDKFIVMYSGNLGKSHPVEILVEIAKRIADEKIFFLIIGGGDKYQMIREKIKTSDLKNIRLLPWQPTEMLPYTLSAADLAVVTLDKDASNLSIPSKTFDFLSVGVPILGISDSNSDLSKFIKVHEIGSSFGHEELPDIINYINRLSATPSLHARFSRNSLSASRKFTADNAFQFV